ncbi:hypothetical protein A2Z33_00295 [Candidatus Gottesmanbacteria bacterium RBG_16_52_11]|uniref:Uncharacterized protein n=1 Tax=Candidatus Gottesmanbacteria bacterium RBG_16_52_11 TaxID=1798374 RepID=A0A1F5YNN5_9BACT|nr:MAG: hypothetical protein A2Z33_00295 [Candidatus Gottesmanbacteria bacterium RBG_16_52_11]
MYMAIIYGIDSDKPVSCEDVRDAIVECFTQAHQKELEDLRQYAHLSDNEFEQLKRVNVRQMVRQYFLDSGGDYDRPTKQSLIGVIDKLKTFAWNFRSPEIIARQYGEIMQLVERLPA